jgi:hypothetical protein
MHKSFFLFLILSFIPIYSCDDGDIITFELDFEATFRACEGVNDVVFYKIKEDPSESLSLLITNYTLEDFLEVGDDNTFSENKSATLYYRTYSDIDIPNNLFCNDIPPQVTIIENEESACTAQISNVLIEDDNDGVLASLEVDGDTDGDGLPDFIDADDDGDNILTKDENPDPNGDGDVSDAQDTDGDGIPDYLDADDDGDGVNTIDEENDSQDNNPANDITNSDVGADFLNPDVATKVDATGYREHTILQTYTVTIKITGISLRLLSQDLLDFGVLENGNLSGSRKVTPNF